MRRTILFVSLALSLPLAAASEPFGKDFHKTCAQLQGAGWTAPVNPTTKKPGKAEMEMGGVVYMCMLTHALKAAGSGHAPDLQALLSTASHESSLILSADIWCTADRAATFGALVKELERVTGSVPEPIAAAIRAGKDAKATANGMTFEVAPVEVDSGACERAPAGELGPVLMKIDVKVEPAH